MFQLVALSKEWVKWKLLFYVNDIFFCVIFFITQKQNFPCWLYSYNWKISYLLCVQLYWREQFRKTDQSLTMIRFLLFKLFTRVQSYRSSLKKKPKWTTYQLSWKLANNSDMLILLEQYIMSLLKSLNLDR